MKIIMWANVCARLFILLVLYVLAAPFFLLTWLGAIGELYLAAFTSFQQTTGEFIARIDHQLNKGK